MQIHVDVICQCAYLWILLEDRNGLIFMDAVQMILGVSVAEWLACWTLALKSLGSNRSHDAVG